MTSQIRLLFALLAALNLAALIYQLLLYPLFDLLGTFSGNWY